MTPMTIAAWSAAGMGAMASLWRTMIPQVPQLLAASATAPYERARDVARGPPVTGRLPSS